MHEAEGEAPVRRLTFGAESLKETWSDAELQALVEFVLFHDTGERWPTHKRMEHWKNAADFVKNAVINCYYNYSSN